MAERTESEQDSAQPINELSAGNIALLEAIKEAEDFTDLKNRLDSALAALEKVMEASQ